MVQCTQRLPQAWPMPNSSNGLKQTVKNKNGVEATQLEETVSQRYTPSGEPSLFIVTYKTFPAELDWVLTWVKSILNPSHRLWRGKDNASRMNHDRSCCHTYWAWLPRWRYYVGRCSLCQEVHLWRWFPPLDQYQSSCRSRSSSQWNT